MQVEIEPVRRQLRNSDDLGRDDIVRTACATDQKAFRSGIATVERPGADTTGDELPARAAGNVFMVLVAPEDRKHFGNQDTVPFVWLGYVEVDVGSHSSMSRLM